MLDLEAHRLRVRQGIPLAHDVAQRTGQGVDHLRDALGGHEEAVALRLHAGLQWARPGQELVEGGVRRLVVGRVAQRDVDVEVGLHLVDEADRRTVELARRALERRDVPGQELPSLRGQRGLGRDIAQQGAGLGGEPGRVGRVLGLHGPTVRRVAEVGVHESGFDAVEPQAEPQVTVGDAQLLHACQTRGHV